MLFLLTIKRYAGRAVSECFHSRTTSVRQSCSRRDNDYHNVTHEATSE